MNSISIHHSLPENASAQAGNERYAGAFTGACNHYPWYRLKAMIAVLVYELACGSHSEKRLEEICLSRAMYVSSRRIFGSSLEFPKISKEVAALSGRPSFVAKSYWASPAEASHSEICHLVSLCYSSLFDLNRSILYFTASGNLGVVLGDCRFPFSDECPLKSLSDDCLVEVNRFAKSMRLSLIRQGQSGPAPDQFRRDLGAVLAEAEINNLPMLAVTALLAARCGSRTVVMDDSRMAELMASGASNLMLGSGLVHRMEAKGYVPYPMD